MKDLQAYMKDYQKEMGWEINEENYFKTRESLLNNYMLLTTEVAEFAEELRKIFNLTQQGILNGLEQEEAFLRAKESAREDIGKELADCLAYLLKFYNYFDLDLEESFYGKMKEVRERKNKDF
ncbi:MAG: MazG nucleotide pyrophosphohydrolase domain-containing protein [Mesobacillus sp.]|uniref:MazG nucleotide pyrophosphohydrolase domain-containing protein n=1 Tax=Mesobacillus sp. TaxID=2675271 RepID=UPI003C5965C7